MKSKGESNSNDQAKASTDSSTTLEDDDPKGEFPTSVAGNIAFYILSILHLFTQVLWN